MSVKYSHLLDIGFQLESARSDPYEDPPADIVEAMQNRVDYLRQHLNEVYEAFGHYDTYQIEDPIDDRKLPGDSGGIELPRS
jgi:hypothetical protein